MFNKSLRLFVTVFRKKAIQRHPICLTDATYDCILYEIECQEKIELERNVSGNSEEEYYWCKH